MEVDKIVGTSAVYVALTETATEAMVQTQLSQDG